MILWFSLAGWLILPAYPSFSLQSKKKQKNRTSPSKSSNNLTLPIKYNINGFNILVGKNNKQNDYVTFTLGGPRDLWFHTKDIPGSHIIMKAAEPSQEDISLAAELAAYFSKARHSSNVPVDCVERRYVKKPAGSKPGFVIFTNQKTYYTTPDEQALRSYLQQS